jgi:hypothetical protein
MEGGQALEAELYWLCHSLLLQPPIYAATRPDPVSGCHSRHPPRTR